jgi:hypothetical protein
MRYAENAEDLTTTDYPDITDEVDAGNRRGE